MFHEMMTAALRGDEAAYLQLRDCADEGDPLARETLRLLVASRQLHGLDERLTFDLLRRRNHCQTTDCLNHPLTGECVGYVRSVTA